MLSNPYLQYRQAQTETAEPGELVVMLYRGAVNFVQRAAVALRQLDYQTANTNLLRAQDILIELSTTLDTDAGPVAVNLARIYDYAYWRLVQANCKKDPEQAEEVLGILRDLLPAWQEAVRLARLQRGGASFASVYRPALAVSAAR